MTLLKRIFSFYRPQNITKKDVNLFNYLFYKHTYITTQNTNYRLDAINMAYPNLEK